VDDLAAFVSGQRLVFVGSLLAFGLFIFVVSPILARRRIKRWAASHRLHLIEFSSMPFWKGPRALRSTQYQSEYHIVVETADGVRREGALLENWPFLYLGGPSYEVEWDA
jgi:hypothetical protein